MTDYETASGLVVRDRRHDRAGHIPNGNVPSTVGPESAPGRYVMYPEGGWHAETWDGWPTEWVTPPAGDDWSGYGVGRHNPMFSRVSTAFTCVDLNSRELGSFPVYGMRGETPFVLPDWASSPEPELWESFAQFMQAAVNSLMLRGECILWVTGRGSNGWPARFTLLDPNAVDVEFLDGRQVVTLAGGEELPRDDVNITRYQSVPGRLRGISPLEWSASSLATASALERYAAGLATRGGVPWAVLKAGQNLNSQQASEAQARWVAASQRRDGAPAVLGSGWDLESVTLSPKDMALLELREFDERRICAAFGVPSYLVNVSMAGGMTYANSTALFFQHWTATLRPIANLIASSWSRWLLPRGQRLEFNSDRYTQPPMAERAQTWRTMFEIVDPVTGERAMSIPEIRRAERLNPNDDAAPSGAMTMTGASMDGDR